MSNTSSLIPLVEPHAALSSRLGIMMFLQFFIWGSWYVSMPGWMGTQNISGLGAWAYTVCPIAALVSPFFLGIIADRFFPTQKVMGVLHLLGGVALMAVPSVVAAANRAAPDAESATILHPYIPHTVLHADAGADQLAFVHAHD